MANIQPCPARCAAPTCTTSREKREYLVCLEEGGGRRGRQFVTFDPCGWAWGLHARFPNLCIAPLCNQCMRARLIFSCSSHCHNCLPMIMPHSKHDVWAHTSIRLKPLLYAVQAPSGLQGMCHPISRCVELCAVLCMLLCPASTHLGLAGISAPACKHPCTAH